MMNFTMTKDDVEKISGWIGAGMFLAVARLFFLGMIVLLVLSAALEVTGTALRWAPGDDSDASYSDRSGVRVRTDHLTGCQYLESSQGDLVARRTPGGQQVCVVAR